LSIVHRLETRQVDYENAFFQADLGKKVYIEPPQGFKEEFPEMLFFVLTRACTV